MVVDDGQAPDARLDVIAQLDAHQQNVEARLGTPSAAVLALPLPPICALVGVEAYADRRGVRLEGLASELGGGDGPVPVADLSSGEEPLEQQLRALWDRGIRALFIDGAREQPGFARAVSYRWPGALHELEVDPMLDALLAPSRDVFWIAPTVAVVAPGIRPPSHAEVVLVALEGDVDPCSIARHPEGAIRPVAVDRKRVLGPWCGTLPPEASFGTELGAKLRACWDAYWTGLGCDHVVRAAALGLDPALESSLAATVSVGVAKQSARESDRGTSVGSDPGDGNANRKRRAKIVAITGIDGSGKSSHVAWLGARLRERGVAVRVLKPYRHGAFLDLANELSGRTRNGAPLAMFRCSRIVKLIDSLRVYRDFLEPGLTSADVLLMDRYVETHIAAARSQLGWDITNHPALAPFPEPDLRFWLEIDPKIALERRETRAERPTADEHLIGLYGYARDFARQAHGSSEIRLDATAAPAANERTIWERVQPLLSERRGRPVDASDLVPPQAPRPARVGATDRCQLLLGPESPSEPQSERPLPPLGAEVLALRGALPTWCGASGVPESFWLEAYAANAVLDLRLLATESARLLLWPAAIAAMPGHGDLPALSELTRMLRCQVEIVSCVASAPEYVPVFVALGATRAAATRLSRHYAEVLQRIGTEAGWPLL